MTDPIIKTVTVPLPPARAFDLFTREISDWWPLDTHSISADADERAVDVEIPPRVGEQIFETRADGSKVAWGRVTEWDEGRAFAMRWQVGRPETDGTEVRVQFDVVADGTKVTLVHSGWAALGGEAAVKRAGYDSGWDRVLGTCFANACARAKSFA